MPLTLVLMGMQASGVHHIELWTADLAAAEPSFHWLLLELGWTLEHVNGWEQGRIWRHSSGLYIVLEQSPAIIGDHHDRLRPGLNHLALTCADRAALDHIRDAAPEHGWSELFGDTYPHAGGPEHVAWFAENADGFEVEVVATAS